MYEKSCKLALVLATNHLKPLMHNKPYYKLLLVANCIQEIASSSLQVQDTSWRSSSFADDQSTMNKLW